jgi:uncharacterized protein YjbI with pentapeptide repeats
MKLAAKISTSFALVALALAAPAFAQDAGQIARVKGGASCGGCNLFQADLAGAELPGGQFSRARLRQSDLTLAVMGGANFAGADLRDVNAFAGVFSSANFTGADMTNSSWVGAHLGGARLAGAKLSGANLSGAELEGAHGLTQAQLNAACGDADTRLPGGLTVPACR